MKSKATTTETAKFERDQALSAHRRQLLNAQPEQALDLVADHPYPVTLVQSLAEEDLYRLVHTIGPDDALPVLSLASNDQWEHLLDMDTWHRDTLDVHSMTVWLQRLLKADPDRFTHWITRDKTEDVCFYLFKNIELHIREYDQDPGEIGDDFFSEDQTYYIRFKPYAPEYEKQQEARDRFLADLLKRLSVFDFIIYRDMLLQSHALIPAESEEELHRLRGGRLAEKGFLPFEEAVGVYQPIAAQDLAAREHKAPPGDARRVESYPLPVDRSRGTEQGNLFARTLAAIQDPATLEQLQTEFAGLCNQIAAADQRPIRERAVLDQVVQKAGDYISIGLEKIDTLPGDSPAFRHAQHVQTHLLSDIFRVGYGCALALKWTADKWYRASWFNHQGLPLSFLGEAWMGILGGLLLKKPLYYNPVDPGNLYREFSTLAEIEDNKSALNDMIAFDDLFSLMDLDTRPVQGYGFLTVQNMILTLWANHHLGSAVRSKSPVPMTLDQFRKFHRELFSGQAPPYHINDSMRGLFLGWLADRSKMADYDIAGRMAPALQAMFDNVEAELGRVAVKDLDPRFIHSFLFK